MRSRKAGAEVTLVGRLVFAPLLAGVLFLAACGGGEEDSASKPPAQSAEVPAGVAAADVKGSPDVESAEAGQEQAAAGLGEGDSQTGDGSGNSEVIAAATEEPDASIPPEPTAQVAGGGEQEAASAEESEIPEDSQAVAQDFVSSGEAGDMGADGAGELEGAGFAGEELGRIPEDSGVVVADQAVNWRRLALILAAAIVSVALVAVGLLGWVLGRRGAVAPTVPGVEPVATDATAVQGSAARVPTVLVSTAEGLGELKDELVQAAVLGFSKAVDERDAEIKRYKDDYDLTVFGRRLRRFINVDLALLHALKENPDDENLGELRKFLDDAFEECGVRRFKPEVGSLYKEAWGVLDHPKPIPTDDKTSDGCIAEVVEPGYQFTGQANGPMLVWGAKVQIYRFEGKKEEA